MPNTKPNKNYAKSMHMDKNQPKTQPNKINKTSIINIKENPKSTHNRIKIPTRIRITQSTKRNEKVPTHLRKFCNYVLINFLEISNLNKF